MAGHLASGPGRLHGAVWRVMPAARLTVLKVRAHTEVTAEPLTDEERIVFMNKLADTWANDARKQHECVDADARSWQTTL